jgi:hypothetical protein
MSEPRRAIARTKGRAPLAAAALALLAAALFVLGGCSASEAWNSLTRDEALAYSLSTTAPIKPGLIDHGEDWKHLRQVLGYFQKHDLRYPAVYLVGGSVTRECTINDLSWRKQIVNLGGPRVEAFNLGAMNQSFDDNIAMIDKLPDVPTIVIISVNLGRYTWKGRSTEEQALRVTPTASGVIEPYAQHKYTWNHIASDERKRERVRTWLNETYPVFKANFSYNAGQLDKLVALCLERGFHPVIMNMPLNKPIVRHALDAPFARVANNCRNIAEKYGIPYVDFLPKVDFVSRDFLDIWHCVEPGRVKWQIRVSRTVVRMLARYHITTLPTSSPSPGTSASSSAASAP